MKAVVQLCNLVFFKVIPFGQPLMYCCVCLYRNSSAATFVCAHAQFVLYERHTLSTRLMARTRARSTSSSESDATSGEDEEGERAADTGARDPPFHISSLLSPSSSFSSKQKWQQLLLSAG